MVNFKNAIEVPSKSESQELNITDGFVTGISNYVSNPDAFATILHRLCINTYGKEFDSWEVDTIVKELKEDASGIPDTNIDKILSIVSLNNSMDGRLCFFNELNCFRHTVNSLNNLEPDYEILGALTPQHCVWTIYEIEQLYPDYKLSEEPAKFMALSFYHHGYMLLPDGVSEYQELLDDLNNNIQVNNAINKEWEKSQSKDPDYYDEDNFIHTQILMLKSCQSYMDYKKKMYSDDLQLIQTNEWN